MKWPEVVELEDITIAPLVQGSSKSNLALAADPPSPALEHFRFGRHLSEIRILPLSNPDAAAANLVEEPTIYGGLLFHHFGHSLCESIHRLWPRFALKELHGAKIAFSLVNKTKVMPYVTEALNLHGISRRNVIRIDEPTRFRRLFVGPQARQMAGPTIIPGYQTMLDPQLAKYLPPPGGNRRLYISRMHHHHTGSFYGESLIEEVLADAGFEIIYPELHRLTELVTMLRSSSLAVFAEGSAIHALELCGSATPAVCVIGRRSGAVERFTPLLSNICGKWIVTDHWLVSAGMSVDHKKHSGVVDLAAVADDLCAFADLAGGTVGHAAVMEAITRDLEAHIGDARNGQNPDHGARAQDLRQIILAAALAG